MTPARRSRFRRVRRVVRWGRRVRLLGTMDAAELASALGALRERGLNYTTSEVRRPQWNFDRYRYHLGTEPPGPPLPGGLWERASQLMGGYEFTPPELLRAAYLADTPLLNRDLLLEGRFWFMRFLMAVRITEVRELGCRDGRQHGWGWCYETLTGHLERGRVDYQIVKDLGSGEVSFVAEACSQLNPRVNALLRLGWLLFGRRTQLRFYRRIGQRMAVLSRARRPAATGQAPPAVTVVPRGVRPTPADRFALYIRDPAGWPEPSYGRGLRSRSRRAPGQRRRASTTQAADG